MLPYELKMDKDGLLYFNDDRILMHTPLLIDQREVSEHKYYLSGFYRLSSTNDYIIKYCYTCYTKSEILAIKEMLMKLIEKQKNVPDVDFPIGYFKYGRRLAGQIIKYYQDSISYENVLENKDINLIGKYYAHDEDTIHNLFLIFNDVLNHLYEMFENGIYYYDINPGNIILTNNEVKIIDFDYHYVKFDQKDKRLATIMDSYVLLLIKVLSNYHLIDGINGTLKDFEHAKTFTKTLENTVRKGR